MLIRDDVSLSMRKIKKFMPLLTEKIIQFFSSIFFTFKSANSVIKSYKIKLLAMTMAKLYVVKNSHILYQQTYSSNG